MWAGKYPKRGTSGDPQLEETDWEAEEDRAEDEADQRIADIEE